MSTATPAAGDDHLLEIDNLTKTFKGLLAVDRYHVWVQPGEILGIIGPNGAGKTTVFNLITGVLAPTGGRIRFRGQDIAGHAPHVIARAGIVRTFQNIRIFRALSVLENVKIGLQVHERPGLGRTVLSLPGFLGQERRLSEEAYHLLEMFDLTDLHASPAHGLSFGHQRRLEVRRLWPPDPVYCCWMSRRRYESQRKEELMALITRIKRDFALTILLIEHDMRVIMGICSRIQALNYGEVIAEGTPIEIQNNPRVIEAYLGHSQPTTAAAVRATART